MAEFLEGIEEQYGQDIAEELVAWAVRHFIDERFGMALHGWSNMLPKLAGAYFPDHDPEVLSPLNPTSTERFREIVRSHFVYSDVFRIKRRIWRAASSNELSSEELEWLRLPPDDFRSEREFFELGQLVDTLIGFCKAIQAWLAIEAVFTEEEVSLIRDWAVQNQSKTAGVRTLLFGSFRLDQTEICGLTVVHGRVGGRLPASLASRICLINIAPSSSVKMPAAFATADRSFSGS